MLSKLHALAFLIIGLIFLVQTVAGMAELGIIDSKLYHAPNQSLDINVTIRHDELITGNPELEVYLNNTLEESIDLQNYFQEASTYSYKSHPFSYNITANGQNTWEEYPDVDFSFSVDASGYKGANCDVPWNLIQEMGGPYQGDDDVNVIDGLKKIRNVSEEVLVPNDCPENTTWTVNPASSVNPSQASVVLTMMEVCGGGMYEGYYVHSSGWVSRLLDVSSCGGQYTTRECWIEKFNDSSLNQNYREFGGPLGWPGGGIYKNGNYQRKDLGLVDWDGDEGMVTIYNYDSQATYWIVYLPPNGALLCAYTDYSEINSSSWTRSGTISSSASYTNPYQRQWTESELELTLNYPNCPCSNCNCTKTVSSYSVVEYQDTDNAITVTFDEPTLTVTGTCALMDFTRNYTTTVPLADHIETPPQNDSHNLSVKLISGGIDIVNKSHQFYVCADLDGDEYCEERGDCNDTDASINPDASEICDYKDNNCDGEIDEDFYGEEFECVLNMSCNDWNGSVCNGTCVCTEDGLNVTCNSTYSIGELDEVCLNEKDDDCDGVVDEMYDIINDTETEGCVWSCVDGTETPCGSDIGFCTPGKRTCVDGEWGPCMDARVPRTEVCNMGLSQLPRYADDDCDGVIDNVLSGTSIFETKCQCYNGNSTRPEVCNGIDDDCDNDIDERACRCSEGETRDCGTDIGICRPGIQYCEDGWWGTRCHGAVDPNPEGEICYNDLDDNCDGRTDEDCIIRVTCENNEWDLNEDGVDCGGDCPDPCEYPIPWIIFSIVIIAFIVTFIILEVKGKIPA